MKYVGYAGRGYENSVLQQPRRPYVFRLRETAIELAKFSGLECRKGARV
jgi:hypothetical protein